MDDRKFIEELHHEIVKFNVAECPKDYLDIKHPQTMMWLHLKGLQQKIYEHLNV